jgi:hypothetical protein
MLPRARSWRVGGNGTVSCGVRRGRVPRRGWLVTATLLLVLAQASHVNAQAPNTCPPNLNDTPALSSHLNQADIASGKLTFAEVFEFGRQLFITNFNACDGAGRPGSTGPVGTPGVGAPRTPDPFKGPRFTGLSGPDANSCASCHNEPGVGGAASFRGNLAEGAQDCDPVAGVDLSQDLFGKSPTLRPCRAGVTLTPTVSDGFFPTFNERGSLGLFGSGAIELLGREMTDDLLNLQTQAIQQAHATHQDVTKTLQTKGVQFGTLIAHPDGSVDTSNVQGVSPDLVIRPMGRTGNHKSIRRFSNQAFNRHLGMQPEEAVQVFGQQGFSDPKDPDLDEVSNELTIGDVTALIVFEAALPIPRRVNLGGAQLTQATRGENLFAQVGCTGCHIPALPLRSTVYCEPNPRNADGTFVDQNQKFCFDLHATSGVNKNLVAAFTDLKRHTICDRTRPYHPLTNHYCSDIPLIPGIASTDPSGPLPADPTAPRPPFFRPDYDQFLTAKLWDVGNSGPWGHRNDLDTIYESIVAHGGEAATSVASYESLSDADQLAVVAFLKTLVMPIMENNPMSQAAGTPEVNSPGF